MCRRCDCFRWVSSLCQLHVSFSSETIDHSYVIHRPDMNWLKFLSYIQGSFSHAVFSLFVILIFPSSGISFAYEGVVVNEFTYPMPCDPAQIVPFGEAREVAYQTCAVPGSKIGSLIVQGSDYVRESLGYSHSHLWRNVGVLVRGLIVISNVEVLIKNPSSLT